MKQWPSNPPVYLSAKLDQLAQYRDAPASSDIWGVLKEWLEAHGVEPVGESVPEEKIRE